MRPGAVVIVGAGLAGARTAETLRAHGFPGRVVLVGEEPVPPYERPALSKEFLAGSRDETSLLLRPPTFWDEHEVELLLADRVVSIDPSRRRVETRCGRALEFGALVLATGARPRRLAAGQPSGVHELRTLADARRLRGALAPFTRLAIVGAGLVGAEVASTAAALGVRVTIVEAAPTPLARVVGQEVGLMLAARWRAQGGDVRLGTSVARFRTDAGGRVEALRLDDGTDVRADAVLVGVGVDPARELLPAAPVPGLHLAGDVAGSGSWTAAAHDGVAAAHRILGLPAPGPSAPYAWSDQFGLRIQIVGVPQPGDTVELDGTEDSFAAHHLGADGSTHAGIYANRPADAAALRRSLAELALSA